LVYIKELVQPLGDSEHHMEVLPRQQPPLELIGPHGLPDKLAFIAMPVAARVVRLLDVPAMGAL